MYQIKETISLEDIQQQSQLNWIIYVTQRENIDTIKMFTYDTILNKTYEAEQGTSEKFFWQFALIEKNV